MIYIYIDWKVPKSSILHLTAHLRSGENSWAWSIPDIAGFINEESAYHFCEKVNHRVFSPSKPLAMVALVAMDDLQAV